MFQLFLLLRRIAAFLYDCMLLLALFFIITALAVHLNGGLAIESVYYKLLLIPVAGFFFCWFWKHGGQTLGMRAWRIKVVNEDSVSPTWMQCIKRYLFGLVLFGVTLLTGLFNQSGTTLHDTLSNTRIERVKPNK